MIFNGDVTDHDVDAVGGERITFAGEADTCIITGTYSPLEQTIEIDLDAYMAYAEKGPSMEGRFEYTITADIDDLNAAMDITGNAITIPEGTDVGVYALTVKAHEKKPFISPLILGEYGTEDVYLTVNVEIGKADPVIVIKPETSDVDYGSVLSDSVLTGGEAQDPTTGTVLEGTFAWTNGDTKPTVIEAASAGYNVTFTPNDTKNYNNANTNVTLTVNKVYPENITLPEALGGIYNGSAQNLIKPGSVDGGTMMYSLEKDGEYSTDSPARANVGTYEVWYKVVGDENHKDTEPMAITVVISPYVVDIVPGSVMYNGRDTFIVTTDGVSDETVIATLTTSSKNVGRYVYATEIEDGKYTVELSSSNYTVGDAQMLTIEQKPVVLSWNEPLAFYFNGRLRTVTATVSNAEQDDTFSLTYRGNTGINVGGYTAEVTGLENDNYTLIDAVNVTQPWYITKENESITLLKVEPVTYGDKVTLIATISNTDANSICLMALDSDKVEFYANGKLLDSVDVEYDDSAVRDSGTAILTINATSANNFSAGANVVTAVYSGNDNVNGGEAAITVTVIEKPIAARMIGDEDKTTKIYDGNDIATGLEIELIGVESCDVDNVTVTADTYTYNSANVTEAKIITAQNIMLDGEQRGNYVLTDEPVTIAGNIEPKVVRLEWSGYEGLVYTGNPVNVMATATELVPDDECMVEVIDGQQINVGTYTATATRLTNSNYTLPATDTTQEYTISPATVYIVPESVVYNGNNTFMVALDGVNSETVIAILTTSSKNAGEYEYAIEAEDDKYTVELSSTNYIVAAANTFEIKPKAVVLSWNEPLTFIYNGQIHEVNATVNNAEQGDTFTLSYMGNTGTNAGTYTAEVIGLGNDNYTLIDAVNVTQTWYITKESESVTLAEVDPVTYGDKVTLMATISNTDANSIRRMALDSDKIEFYANGKLLDSVDVEYDDSAVRDSGTAILTINATSANNFSAGANVVTAVYSGNDNVSGGEAAITVTVIEKAITAKITGDTTKTYDGNDIATGLEIELIGVESCDDGKVTATADTYTYNSANVTEAKTITAQNITLDGEQRGNYVLDTKPVTIPGSIDAKVVRLEWSGYKGLVYTGNAVNVIATINELIPGDECIVEVINGQQANVGTYTATATGLSNSNYTLPATGTTQEYTIYPATVYIVPESVVYNGNNTFTFTLDGVNDEVVIAILTTSSKNAGKYEYAIEAEEGKYTVKLSNTNYIVAAANTFEIKPKAVVLG